MTLNESFGEGVLSFLQDKQQDLQSISSVVDAVVRTVRCRSLCQCLCLCPRPLHLFLSLSSSLGVCVECISGVSLPCEHTNFARAQVNQLRLRTSARSLTRMHTYAREQSLEEKKHSRKFLSTQQRSVEIFAAADCVAGRQAAARGVRRASQVRICYLIWCASGYYK